MWICIDCEKEFGELSCFRTSVGITCPFCGSATIVDCIDFYQPEMGSVIDDAINSLDCSEQDYIDASLEMPEYIEEQIADMYATMKDLIPKMPEHPNCRCVNGFEKASFNMSSIDWIRNNPVIQIPLSFDDLEINEKLLIGLPVTDAILNMQKKPGQYDAYEKCITEMNERFLHTFIDDCFVS